MGLVLGEGDVTDNKIPLVLCLGCILPMPSSDRRNATESRNYYVGLFRVWAVGLIGNEALGKRLESSMFLGSIYGLMQGSAPPFPIVGSPRDTAG